MRLLYFLLLLTAFLHYLQGTLSWVLNLISVFSLVPSTSSRMVVLCMYPRLGWNRKRFGQGKVFQGFFQSLFSHTRAELP